MSTNFPSKGIAKKFKRALSADDTLLSSTITVSASNYGVIYKLWVCLDVGTEADLENLVARVAIGIDIGPTVNFTVNIHPYIEHTDAHASTYIHRTVDLRVWDFDFGLDGLYSGVKGDNIVVEVSAAGTGIKSVVNYLYSGD